MTRKTKFFAGAVAALALAAFTGYKTLTPKSDLAQLMLDENVEALTSGETGGGYYVHHYPYREPWTNTETGKCFAYSYQGPYGRCKYSHNHHAIECCSINC